MGWEDWKMALRQGAMALSAFALIQWTTSLALPAFMRFKKDRLARFAS